MVLHIKIAIEDRNIYILRSDPVNFLNKLSRCLQYIASSISIWSKKFCYFMTK